ncbi:MAG: DNA translocase FtsK, partial [Acidimicrobiia bacterium]|nr:DNA translocase FtsK [Acidimicrobiia bacterium]
GRKRVSTKNNKTKTSRTPRTSKLASLRERFRRRLGSQADDVWGIALIVIALLMGLAFLGEAGPLGRGMVSMFGLLFGLWSYLIPVALAGIGMALVIGKPRTDYGKMAAGIAVTFFATLALFHLLTGAIELHDNLEIIRRRGGAVGSLTSFPLKRLLGFWGAFVVLAATTSMGVLVATRTTVRELFTGFAEIARRLKRWASSVEISRSPKPVIDRGRHVARPARVVERPAAAKQAPQTGPDKTRPEPKPKPAKKTSPKAKRDGSYSLPPLDLLDVGAAEGQNRRALEETAQDLEEALRQHGVDATLTKIVPGPTVTRYEIELAAGVKVSRITNLSHDIAYALATPDIRLLAPIPGKSAIGVEVPNRRRRIVTLGDILRSPEAAAAEHPLTVAVGMDINGTPTLVNLAELPHVLIAGATGAGKSSSINSLVTSLLMRTTPDDVRLIMVDPKRVELGQYNGVPHLLTRVITNPKKASDALKWAVEEMDRRYDLLADAGVRDIGGYREKLDIGGLDPEGFDRFPYLVVIIDELNDLMMVAGREVESSIVRIAQMARAVGIHLVIATQRPSVNVITGVIKANVPSRMAFSVASQTDSRVIIDTIGADKLVGMGDMLLVTAKEPKPERIQGAWVSEREIHAVVDWVKKQREAKYQDKVIEATVQAAKEAAAEEDDEDADLVRQAMDLVIRSGLGSTSMLQRKLRIGFARAGRVMDVLEQRGVVGPSLGSKAREVLMTLEDLEAMAGSE